MWAIDDAVTRNLVVRDVDSRRVVRTVGHIPEAYGIDLAFAPDGKQVAVSNSTGTVYVAPVDGSGPLKPVVLEGVPAAHGATTLGIAWPKADRLVVGFDGGIAAHDPATGRRVARTAAGDDPHLLFAARGLVFTTGIESGKRFALDPDTLTAAPGWHVPGGFGRDPLAVAPDRPRIAWAVGHAVFVADQTAGRWPAPDPLRPPTGPAAAIRFSADGRRVLTTDHSRYHVWDLATGRTLAASDNGDDPRANNADAFLSPDGRSVVASQLPDTDVLRDVATGAVVRREAAPARSRVPVGFDPGGSFWAWNHDDRRLLTRFDPMSGRAGRTLPGLPGTEHVLMSANGRRLAAAGWRAFAVRDTDPAGAWQTVEEYPEPKPWEVVVVPYPVPDSWSPDGTRLATVRGETLTVWDVTGRPTRLAHRDGVSDAPYRLTSFSPDGRRLIVRDPEQRGRAGPGVGGGDPHGALPLRPPDRQFGLGRVDAGRHPTRGHPPGHDADCVGRGRGRNRRACRDPTARAVHVLERLRYDRRDRGVGGRLAPVGRPEGGRRPGRGLVPPSGPGGDSAVGRGPRQRRLPNAGRRVAGAGRGRVVDRDGATRSRRVIVGGGEAAGGRPAQSVRRRRRVPPTGPAAGDPCGRGVGAGRHARSPEATRRLGRGRRAGHVGRGSPGGDGEARPSGALTTLPENVDIMLSTAMSPLRAFVALAAHSFGRQWRVRQMGLVALGLLMLAVTVVGVVNRTPARFGFVDRKYRKTEFTYRQYAVGHLYPNRFDPGFEPYAFPRPWNPVGNAVQSLLLSVPHAVAESKQFVNNWAFMNFTRWVIVGTYLGFVLPLFTLAYASGAIGAEREGRSLVWLLTRPVPRSAVYLGTFAGTLPWCVLFGVGGFAALCLAGGDEGRRALALYWPAAVGGTLAFSALFHLIGALRRRPVVIGLVYVFFYEGLVAALPGSLKKFSLNYYARCLVYNEAHAAGYPADMLDVPAPVSSATAWAVLLGAAVVLTGVGMWLFSRAEPQDERVKRSGLLREREAPAEPPASGGRGSCRAASREERRAERDSFR